MFAVLVYGCVTFTFLFIVYQIIKSQDESNRENRDLANYCEEGRNYLNRYSNNIIDEYLKELFKDEKIKNKAIEARKNYFTQLSNKNDQEKIIWGERRKVGYKYELLIFEIFGNKPFLDKADLLNAVMGNLNITITDANILLNIWESNYLIRYDYNNKNNVEVGIVLKDKKYKLIDTDLTISEWLIQNDKL